MGDSKTFFIRVYPRPSAVELGSMLNILVFLRRRQVSLEDVKLFAPPPCGTAEITHSARSGSAAVRNFASANHERRTKRVSFRRRSFEMSNSGSGTQARTARWCTFASNTLPQGKKGARIGHPPICLSP